MSDRILNLCKQAVHPGDRIVIAVSGGADSMCLAHALHQVLPGMGAQLFVAHVNHQLRGEAAEADAQFVCTWAKEMGLPRAVVRIDVKSQGGESFQNTARAGRYTALEEACRRFNANKLATAHHADDQVETFLLNLLRGSGSKGLVGIPRKRRLNSETVVIRPLLEVSRAEIEDYCRHHQLKWRTDASNNSLYYQRNRVRHQLLPELRTYNPGIDKVLLNTINHLRMDQELLSALTHKSLAKVAVSSSLPFAPRALVIHALEQLDPALRNRVILELLPEGSETKHVDAVLELIKSQTGATVDLPGEFRAYRLHDSIAFGSMPPKQDLTEVTIKIPGQGTLKDILVRTDIEAFPESSEFWLPGHIKNIVVGFRRPGDYFYPSGGGKKLKEYMIDRKIPRWLRGAYPIVRAAGAIIWVVGLARDQRYTKPGPGKKSVHIKIESTGGDSDEKKYWRNPAGPGSHS